MAKRMRRGWQLLQQSFSVMIVNKRFFVFSLGSTVSCLALLAIILSPLHHYEHLLYPLTKAKLHHLLWLYLLLIIFLFFTHVINYFFSIALIACTIDYFKGGSAKIRYGFSAALNTFWRMFFWVIYSTTIGIFVFLFQRYLTRFKRMQDYLIESSWNTATQLILPVLLIEKLSMLKAFRRSADLIYQTWGLSVRPNFGYGSYIILARIIALIPLIISLFVGGIVSLTIGSFITVALYMLINVFSLSTSMILNSAIYLYAAEKIIPPHFDKELQRAFAYYQPKN